MMLPRPMAIPGARLAGIASAGGSMSARSSASPTASLSSLNDLQWLVLQERPELKSGAGEEAGQQRRAVLHPSQAALHQRGQLGDGVLGQVGQRSLQMRPDRLDQGEFVGGRGAA